MLASVVADLVAGALLDETLLTEKLSRRGLRVHAEYHVDVLQIVRVDEVMSRTVLTLSAAAPVREVRRAFARGTHGAYPLLGEDGEVVGIVSRGDLLRELESNGETALDIGSRDVVSVAPGDPLFVALDRMLAEDIEHVPVLEEGRLVGICTRTDILRARQRQLEHERLQPGWWSAVKRRAAQ